MSSQVESINIPTTNVTTKPFSPTEKITLDLEKTSLNGSSIIAPAAELSNTSTPTPPDSSSQLDSGVESEPLETNEIVNTDEPTVTEGRQVLTMRALVSSREAGVIIGKSGHNVANIRESTGCKAGVSKVVPGVNERILTISGKLDSIAKAYKIVVKHLIDNPIETIRMGAHPECSSVRLLVSHQLMGSVIGKAGARIRDIQEESGVRIVVGKEMLPQSTERVIELYGIAEGIETAVKHIGQCILMDIERGAGTILYTPENALRIRNRSSFVDDEGIIPNTMNRRGSRRGSMLSEDMMGLMGNGGRRRSSVMSRNNGFLPGMSAPSIAGSVTSNDHIPSSAASNASGSSYNGYNGASRMSISSSYSKMVGSGSYHYGHSSTPSIASSTISTHSSVLPAHEHPLTVLSSSVEASDPLIKTQTIAIPADMIGCVIGKGGSFINQVRRASGARLRIDELQEGQSNRIVTISGVDKSTQRALNMLNCQLESENQRRLSCYSEDGSIVSSAGSMNLNNNIVQNNSMTTVLEEP